VTQDSLVIIIGTGVVGGLCTAVGVLFRLFVEEKKTTRADLDECRKDREKLWAKIEILQNEIGKLLRGRE
jgi:NaMN:DMB phosphoribosyltransferase